MRSLLLNRTLCRPTAAATYLEWSKSFDFSRAQARIAPCSSALQNQKQQPNIRYSSSNPKQTDQCTPSATYTKISSNITTTIPQTATEQDIRVKISKSGDGITHVLLSRPSKLNSLDLPMFESIASAASQLKQDKDCRVVILSGEGRAFCTGLDAKSVALEGQALERLLDRPSGYDDEDGLGNLAQDVGYLWRQLPVPVIAVLHGMCFGGGMQIALGADFRFSTPDCKLSIMEARWGLIPDMSASVTLRELVRNDVAKELAMTGKIINAEEGARLGLVTRCVEDPMEEAMKVAKEIIERSPDSVAATKELFNTAWVADERTCLKKETDLQLRLIKTYNQIAASGRQFRVSLPYFRRQEWDMK